MIIKLCSIPNAYKQNITPKLGAIKFKFKKYTKICSIEF